MSVGLVSRTIRSLCRLVGAHPAAIKNFGKPIEGCLSLVETLKRCDAAVHLTRSALIWRARGVRLPNQRSREPSQAIKSFAG